MVLPSVLARSQHVMGCTRSSSRSNPLVPDVFCHAFARSDSIARMHCCKGAVQVTTFLQTHLPRGLRHLAKKTGTLLAVLLE